MAKLSSHGVELLRLEYTSYRLAHMSDGKVLRNDGNGWKLYRKLKAGVDPAEHAAKIKESRAATDCACPNWAAYRDGLAAAVPISNRWKLHAAIELMPSDPDGVWSEVCDDYWNAISLGIDEIVELCRAYQAGRPELDAYVAARKCGTAGGLC